jgi:hypothetical protein
MALPKDCACCMFHAEQQRGVENVLVKTVELLRELVGEVRSLHELVVPRDQRSMPRSDVLAEETSYETVSGGRA